MTPEVSTRILLAYDGSEPARRAADLACELAEKLGAKLLVAHVLAPFLYPVEYHGQGGVGLEERRRTAAQRMLDELAAALLPRAVSVETALLAGSPAEELARVSERPDILVVVVGSTGKGAVARLLVGSVADRLVHLAAKPVLVVH